MSERTVIGTIESYKVEEGLKKDNSKWYKLILKIQGKEYGFFMDLDKHEDFKKKYPLGSGIQFLQFKNDKGYWTLKPDSLKAASKEQMNDAPKNQSTGYSRFGTATEQVRDYRDKCLNKATAIVSSMLKGGKEVQNTDTIVTALATVFESYIWHGFDKTTGEVIQKERIETPNEEEPIAEEKVLN